MKNKLLMISCLALAASCKIEKDAPQPKSSPVLCVECADYEEHTKSAVFSETDASRLEDAYLFVYDESGDLVNSPDNGDYETYFTDPNSIDTDRLFPDLEASYTVYALSGCGEVDYYMMMTRSDADSFTLSYSDFSEMSDKGFPKAAVLENFCPASSSLRIKVKRLVSRYNIEIKNDSGYDFRLSSLNVRQSAGDIQPFQSGSCASYTFEAEGDSFSEDECSAMAGTVYVPENVRGEVFDDYNGPSDRTMDKVYDYQQDCCTYLEFTGKLTDTEGGVYENAVFRYIFGKEKNAEVERNKSVDLTLKLSETCTEEDGWRKIPGDYKFISPEKKQLTFSWWGTDTFICPLYSESFSGVTELSPTGSSTETLLVSSGINWTVKSYPSWMSVAKQGSSIIYTVDYLQYGLSARSGSIVLSSTDGSVQSTIAVSQTPPSSWMKFPYQTDCIRDYRYQTSGAISFTINYYSSVYANSFQVSEIFAVKGTYPGIDDFFMGTCLKDISISYQTASSSGDSRLPYKHPVTITIPKATVESLRTAAGADGCILYFDFDNTTDPLYGMTKIFISSGLPRFVLRLY